MIKSLNLNFNSSKTHTVYSIIVLCKYKRLHTLNNIIKLFNTNVHQFKRRVLPELHFLPKLHFLYELHFLPKQHVLPKLHFLYDS